MIRISLPYIFNLHGQIEPLAALPEQDTPYGDIMWTLWGAENAIDELTQKTVYAPYLRSSFQLASEILKLLRETIQEPDAERKVGGFVLWRVKNLYSQYKIALLSELGVLNAFFVTQQGGFDTHTLLGAGELLFPAGLGSKVPEAIFDVREAAKCLAYEVPTAAGFHIFRATEAVLRKYYAHVTGGAAHPKVRSIGVYVSALRRAKKGDPKVLAVLQQMNELHRNPLIHPEAALVMDEALAVCGIARSAMTAMLAEIPVQPPTTATIPQPQQGLLSAPAGA